jgi:molybdate transport system substrate-binding protein
MAGMISVAAAFIAVLVIPASGAGQETTPVPPAELRVWTARALATVLAEVGPEFERTSGVRLRIVDGLPPAFERQAARGEPFDILISGSATVDAWIRAGRVVAATRTDLARSGIGVAVRSGAPRPDLSSVDAFRNALLAAKSIAYLPVGSGLYLDSLFRRLDLTNVIAAKAKRPQGDSVSLMVARGEIELGLVVLTQILTTPGVEFAGPLPANIQSYVTFAAAVSSSARAPVAARQLIAFLQSPAAARVIVSQGMERPPF